jgi:hypothetical protein
MHYTNGGIRDLYVSVEDAINLHVRAIKTWIGSLEVRLTVDEGGFAVLF